jgi:hypothetical protein
MGSRRFNFSVETNFTSTLPGRFQGPKQDSSNRNPTGSIVSPGGVT